MAISKSLSLSILTFALTTLVYAEDKSAFDSSVLPPGGKVVAGDLSKGEFFIIAQTEAAKVKPLPPVTDAEEGKEPFVPAVQTALSKTISEPAKPAPVVSADEPAENVQPTPTIKFAEANLKPVSNTLQIEKKLKPLIKTALNKKSSKTPPIFEVIHARKVGNKYEFVTHRHAYDSHKSFKAKNKLKNKMAFKKAILHSKKLASKVNAKHIEKRKLAFKNNTKKDKKIILAKNVR